MSKPAPMINKFLEFLEKDMQKYPENIQPLANKACS